MSRPLVVKVVVLAMAAMLSMSALVLAGAAGAPVKAPEAKPDVKSEVRPDVERTFKPAGGVAHKASFPPHPEVEFERSVIRIPIRLGGDTAPREIVELTAFMRLEREKPVRNTIGYRQFEFTIREWELFGYSETLGAHISFAATQNVVQPRSLCLALQKETDYPSLIVYNAIYDIFIDGRKVVSQMPGVAMARGVMEIPPRNITVAFQKPFTLFTGEHDHDDEASAKGLKNHGPCITPEQLQDYRCWIFDPGTCEDMSTITSEEFYAGLAEARAIRTGAATLKPKPPASGKVGKQEVKPEKQEVKPGKQGAKTVKKGAPR
jgi:hypothetical protein